MPEHPTPEYANTTQVAKALGLSVSTVKRWVDDGVLPAHKTAGGHRKLLLADVIELARRGNLPHGDLSHLADKSARRPAVVAAELADELYRALLAGDGLQVRAVVQGAFRRGTSIEDLADQTIRPAMARIGLDWELGKIDVMEEHRASQLCAAALFELKAVLEQRAGKDRPRAVGGSPEKDYSVLPTLLAQMVLLDAGWEAVDLGPNTPLTSLTKALTVLRPKLVWLSVCHLDDEEVFIRGYRRLYDQAEKAGVAVAVGGRALGESLRSRIPYTTYGDGLGHLAAFARTLQPRPVPPRRGRPPGK
jgi:MerR family transcriptional regulator, light-induced transcriptional regulator